MDEERAKRLFRHYFKTVWQAAGLRWDSDNDAEIDDAIDCLIAAAMVTSEPSPAATIAVNADAARYRI